MPTKRWIDNIAERTGKSFAETSSHGTHRQEWRELTEKSTMTRGAMGPMQKAGRSVEYAVWCVIRLNNTATPVCIEIHLGRTLSYNEHNTKDKTTKCPQHHHRQACKFEVDNFTNANTNSMLSRPLPHMTAAEASQDVSCQHTSAGWHCPYSHYENCCKPHRAQKTD